MNDNNSKNEIWMDCEGNLLDAAKLAAEGYRQDETFSDGFLTRPQDDNYAERITKFRVHVAACDGDFKKVFASFDKAVAYVRDMGFHNDGGVCEGGYSRYDGTMYKHGGKTWFASEALEAAVLRGSL